MSVDSVLSDLLLLGLVAWLVSWRPFAALDKPWHEVSARTATLDGLRGYLALGVFLHHGAIYADFIRSGDWNAPKGFALSHLGVGTVALFFMITGYLFWGKAVRAGGALAWRALLINRVFRIAPLYWVATALMLVIVFGSQGWVLRESAGSLVTELAPLALFGFYGTGPDINGYANPWIVLAGVTWTLRYEWVFYVLLLPLAAALLRRLAAPRGIPAVALLACLVGVSRAPTVVMFGLTCFSAGMLSAALPPLPLLGAGRAGWRRVGDAVAAGLLALYLTQPLPEWEGLAMLALAFHIIASGADLFGLLSWRGSRRLGEVSYGIYLLQGLALYAVFHVASVHGFALASPEHFWIALCGAAVLLVVGAALAHMTVEWPSIRYGRAVVAGRDLARAARRRDVSAPPATPCASE